MAGMTQRIEDEERNINGMVAHRVSRHKNQPNLVVHDNEWIR
jgi:hypothetical protein